jgi:hypothetical protein
MPQNDQDPNRWIARGWVRNSLGLLIVLVFVMAVGSVVFFWEAIHVFSTPSIWSGMAELKDKLDAYEKHAATLQAMISALLLVTAFYSAGLGVFSYLNARNALEDARRSAGEADKIKGEIRKTFPVFGDLDLAVKRVLNILDKRFPDVDWSRGFYERLNPQEKQEILFYEKAIALFEFLNMQEFREQASQAYRGLGSYYGTKYQFERSHNEDDYERASFYMEKAVSTHENIRTLNDRGAFEMIEGKTHIEKARVCFQRSADLDPKHQRALYNLALIWHREGKTKSGNEAQAAFKRSIELSTEVLPRKRWQEKPETPYQASIRYNRACSYARFAEGLPSANRESLLKKAAEDLSHQETVAAFRNRDEELSKALQDDVVAGGDFYLVAQTQPYAQAVNDLLKLI